MGKRDRITKSSRGNVMCFVVEEKKKGLKWVKKGKEVRVDGEKKASSGLGRNSGRCQERKNEI